MVSGQGHHILGQSEESSVFHSPLMVSSLDLCNRKCRLMDWESVGVSAEERFPLRRETVSAGTRKACVKYTCHGNLTILKCRKTLLGKHRLYCEAEGIRQRR